MRDVVVCYYQFYNQEQLNERRMKHLLLILLCLTVLLAQDLDTLFCTKVSDGDSFHGQNNNGQTIKYRLYGVDCPERDQPYGDSATFYVTKKILNKKITVEKIDVDRYGRVVCKVFFPTEKKKQSHELNTLLLQKGYAWWYKQYAPKEQTYQTAQSSAQRKRVGLWRYKNSIAPWKWRRMSKSARGSEKDAFIKHQ